MIGKQHTMEGKRDIEEINEPSASGAKDSEKRRKCNEEYNTDVKKDKEVEEQGEEDDSEENNSEEDNSEEESEAEDSDDFDEIHQSLLRSVLNFGVGDDSEVDDSDLDEDEYAEIGRSKELGRLQVSTRFLNYVLDQHYQVKEVRGNHRNGCDSCSCGFYFGDIYLVDQSNGVYNAPKLCSNCSFKRVALLSELTWKEISKFKKFEQAALLNFTWPPFNPYCKNGYLEKKGEGLFSFSEDGVVDTAEGFFRKRKNGFTAMSK